MYNQATLPQPLLEITALLLRCTAFLLLAAGAAVNLVVLSCCMTLHRDLRTLRKVAACWAD